METEEIIAAIKADSSLEEAWEKVKDKFDEKIKEGWLAWEWCLRQLIAKGLDLDSALALRGMYMGKAGRLGTYGAINECLFGDQITLVFNLNES